MRLGFKHFCGNRVSMTTSQSMNFFHPCLAFGTSSLFEAESFSTSESMLILQAWVVEGYPRAPRQQDLIKNTPERKWWGPRYELSIETVNDQNYPMETQTHLGHLFLFVYYRLAVHDRGEEIWSPPLILIRQGKLDGTWADQSSPCHYLPILPLIQLILITSQ